MPKLVVLNEGLTVRSHELKVDKTTIGRVEDNTFQIPDASVSSHHCEILLRGSDVIVRDLNSTNGTFINGGQITGEGELKGGQTLRLGQVELRLENGVSSAPVPANTPAVIPAKRTMVSTSPIPTGVNLNELQSRSGGFDTASQGFTKKTNKGNRIFIIAVIVFAVIIAVVLVWIGTHIK